MVKEGEILVQILDEKQTIPKALPKQDRALDKTTDNTVEKPAFKKAEKVMQ